ncbi:hypothetical protein CCR83_07005 [Rhodobacter veldkampii DSM 11550]|uniref:OmpA-like domain-containing protein n=1 Tax=Phaeovulum veldkampii DSM 11550 TaxID=1185920 RepID=A0A2T4JHQ5_9RHOB|nr:OmpA family protein [Phaeovulum veldkampii]MBK5946203.1 hypothetical protein [Phaeovulum veldkampii DSM 11550]PTE17373.1 hypothetical protein C5F46_09660 [Phaeovulum veldkampii DSM 11550]TDQ56596.1 outer membrane protein OmpA-like peptidoglycan-associated protein [Phaeovulum veldkampii DSM 11550]
MKRFLISSTAVSVALATIAPVQVLAQVQVTVGDSTVMCLTGPDMPCPEGMTCVVAPAAPCDTIGATVSDAAAAAATEAAEAEAAAAKALEDAAAAEAALAAEAQAAAEAAAAAADADAAAAAEVDAAATKALEEAAAAEAAAAEAATAAEAQAAAETEAAAPEAATQAAPEAPPAVAVQTPAEKPTQEPAPATDAAAATETAVAGDESLPLVITAEPASEEAVQTLSDILTAPEAAEGGAAPAAAAAAAGLFGGAVDAAPAEGATQTVTAVTEADTRSSDEDFAKPQATALAPAVGTKAKKDDGLTNLEKFGLVVLGGLVVGAILNNGDKVVSNTGDRVVVQRDDGRYVVLKDDDTLIRQPGSTVRTETFRDGSTRSVVQRADGSRIVTIRDASGRVLRRSRLDAADRELVLIDDLESVDRIDINTLPKPRPEARFIRPGADDAELRAALFAAQAREIGRSFSLRQVRDYPEVRALAPTIDVESITFETGSAAIRPSEAQKLSQLGRFMSDLIDENPAEMFLIEGHTDAVGSGSSNLALSDRRAESLALALTEYFGVPPENLVVQGYGEAELLVPTQAAEQRNRRTAVRMISPLLDRVVRR